MSSPIPTSNYVTYYDPAKSHHRAWLQAVLDRLHQLDPAALADGSELRDLWKAAVTTKAPSALVLEQPEAMAVVLPLLKELEGCRLSAYPDPATGSLPWTIGWGSSAPTQAMRTGTMHWLLDLAVAFLALGLLEAVVKPLARRFVQGRILAIAPALLRQLNPLLPGLLQHCSGAELEQVVRQKLEALTGESWASDDLGRLVCALRPACSS